MVTDVSGLVAIYNDLFFFIGQGLFPLLLWASVMSVRDGQSPHQSTSKFYMMCPLSNINNSHVRLFEAVRSQSH